MHRVCNILYTQFVESFIALWCEFVELQLKDISFLYLVKAKKKKTTYLTEVNIYKLHSPT